MKKMVCLIFMVLTSCISAPISSSPIPVNPIPISMKSSFTYNEECPHMCWLGVNPGATTIEDALALLSSSSQINQVSFEKNEARIEVEWHTEQMGVNPIRVYLDIENGVVNNMVFNFYIYVKAQEFIDLIGEPDEISIKQEQWVEGVSTDYFLYYTSKKIVMFVLIASKNGPNSGDSIRNLYLNVGHDNPVVYGQFSSEHKNLRQPWLGFGHLEEYLKNRPSPDE